ncbi:MAG: lamin tail domain-containing protein [Anaerolineales bacterium]|nr:lamin tail domain-containing protein [Anaerolineales bacterium]MCB9144801.1 lamin tail domain-containing protein [Anaerolineales bacterium]
MKNVSLHFMALPVIAILLVSCGDGKASAAPSLSIIPEDCSVTVSEQISLTLSGGLDPNSRATWEANLGSVIYNAQGLTATYIAPPVAGEAIIRAKILSGESTSAILEVLCKIIDPSATTAPPTPTGVVSAPPADLPVNTVIISEVMGNACGGVDLRKYNQYVELYNYGDQPVDVGGWWLYDEGSPGTPDELTAWSSRVSAGIDAQVITNTTVIPPKGVAIVFSPQYLNNPNGARYKLPAGVIILTVAESATLGDDYFGIISDQDGYDTVTLYIGTNTIINSVVDTYGTPSIPNNYISSIEDDRLDTVPHYLSDCNSIERVNPLLPDAAENWITVKNGTPGAVPFK